MISLLLGENQLGDMPSVHAALQEPFQTVVAVADDCFRPVLSAVFLHQLNLFFFRMGQELSFRALHIMLGASRAFRAT